MGDYFEYSRRRGSTSVTQDRLNAPLPPGGRPQRPGRPGSRESLRQPSSIRIRRLPSNTGQSSSRPQSRASNDSDGEDPAVTGRRRSSSAPQRWAPSLAPPGSDLSRQRTVDQAPHMRTITEGVPSADSARTPYQDGRETQQPMAPAINVETPGATPAVDRVNDGAPVVDRAGTVAQRARGLRRFRSRARNDVPNDEYDQDVVDLLDLVDPEVSTIGTLTNVQNSLFVPDLGGLLNRRPTYELSARPSEIELKPRTRAGTRTAVRPPSRAMPTIPQGVPIDIEMQAPRGKRTSISSQLSDSHYAVLPHGVDLEDWSPEEIDEMNDHVRHLLHSRRAGFKRGWKGFRKYISKPLGFFVFMYATLVTLFGAAWVFCLIGWIYIGPKQQYFINVIDNVLVAFFALMGDGLAPFRVVDTYHMCFIAHFHHKTWRLRQEKKLPELVDPNDLPDRRVSLADAEDVVDREETAEFSVLSPREQRRLQYHQAKFSKAHTFYKPHETSTHHAFPLRLLVAVVVLLDCHSLFQVALGTCTWSINYKHRPQALTATILSCSITCNIVAGVIISIGDHRTRKKDVLERIFRQGLTQEAIRHIQQKHAPINDASEVDLQNSTGQTTGADLSMKEAGAGPSYLQTSERTYAGT